MFRNAPLGVVIGQESRVPESPFAPLDRIVAHPRLLHPCPGCAEAKHRPIQSLIFTLRRIASSARIEKPRETANLDPRSEEHTSELQSLAYLVCRLLLEKKNKL